MKNICIFASGSGSNFEALVKANRAGLFKGNIALLISDQPEAFVLKRAERLGIKAAIVSREGFPSKKAFEGAIIELLEANKIDLIVLAGFMRLLSPDFVKRYSMRIVNIHPALLPAFKGANAIADAFTYGVKITGVSVHFVDELTDHGPIILQESVEIKDDDTLKSLEERIHSLEHKLYPEAIRLVLEEKWHLDGRCVKRD